MNRLVVVKVVGVKYLPWRQVLFNHFFFSSGQTHNDDEKLMTYT